MLVVLTLGVIVQSIYRQSSDGRLGGKRLGMLSILALLLLHHRLQDLRLEAATLTLTSTMLEVEKGWIIRRGLQLRGLLLLLLLL